MIDSISATESRSWNDHREHG